MTLFEIIIAIIGVVISSIIIPWVNAKLDSERLTEASFWVSTAVKAAEQLFGALSGDKKYEYVKSLIQSKYKGFKDDDLNILIEAAVLELTATGEEKAAQHENA